MIFKKGDIVKIRNEKFSRERVRPLAFSWQKRFHYQEEIPRYLKNYVGEIVEIKKPTPHFNEKRKIYVIYFLFDLNVEAGYISEYTALALREEIEPATKEESGKYMLLKELFTAKMVAEKI